MAINSPVSSFFPVITFPKAPDPIDSPAVHLRKILIFFFFFEFIKLINYLNFFILVIIMHISVYYVDILDYIVTKDFFLKKLLI